MSLGNSRLHSLRLGDELIRLRAHSNAVELKVSRKIKIKKI